MVLLYIYVCPLGRHKATAQFTTLFGDVFQSKPKSHTGDRPRHLGVELYLPIEAPPPPSILQRLPPSLSPKKGGGRADRDVPAGVCNLWGGRVEPPRRARGLAAWSVGCGRPHRHRDDLRRRPHLRGSHESRRHASLCRLKALPLDSAQLMGATVAAFTLRVLLHPIRILGTTVPSGSSAQALVMEIVVTFSMMFVTSAVATDTKAVVELAGLAVGSAVCITSILAGPISGGSMNPARSFGPAVASNRYDAIWVYFVGPVLGTLTGAWSYSFIRVREKPHHVLSQRESSSSFKLRRFQSQDAASLDDDDDAL